MKREEDEVGRRDEEAVLSLGSLSSRRASKQTTTTCDSDRTLHDALHARDRALALLVLHAAARPLAHHHLVAVLALRRPRALTLHAVAPCERARRCLSASRKREGERERGIRGGGTHTRRSGGCHPCSCRVRHRAGGPSCKSKERERESVSTPFIYYDNLVSPIDRASDDDDEGEGRARRGRTRSWRHLGSGA